MVLKDGKALLCKHCGSDALRKKGFKKSGRLYYCNNCRRYFTDKNDKRKEATANALPETAPDNETIDDTIWTYVDKNRKEAVPWQDFIEHAKTAQKFNERLSTSQDRATIRFLCDKEWLPVIFSADWHLGSVSINYDEFVRHINFVLENDIYMCLVGDLIDNFKPPFRSAQAILQQIMNPKMQKEFLAAIIREFQGKNKILAAWWGNHDVEWDENKFGESPVKQMLSEQFAYFNGIGRLTLHVNNQHYTIGASHYFKGYSIYNKTHALIRAVWQQFGQECDVVVQGDRHVYAYQYVNQYEKDLHLLQIGTFKEDDGYSKRFWGKGQIGIPVMLFNTRRHDIMWLRKPEYLKYYI